MNTSDGSIQQSDNPPSDGDIPRLPLETLLGGTSNPETPLTRLKELVAFSELGTLAAASRALLLTQPTVTRGIQQLERTLGVPLFDHQPNRLILTDAGRIYARRARAILGLCADSVATVRGYVSAQDAAAVLSLGATLPGPTLWLDQVYKPSPGSHAYRSDDVLCPPDWVVPRLRQYSDALIFTSEEIFTADQESHQKSGDQTTASPTAANATGEEVESAFIGTERIAVRVNKFSGLAGRRSVTFADLHDQQFLVVTDIGPWKQIIEDNIPGARFMYQQDPDSLQILQDSSSFPTFTSNLSKNPNPDDDDRVTIPIDDPANRVDVYGAYLVSQKKRVMPLLHDMTRQWPAPIAGPENQNQ
jgi:hypothetical protein